MYTLFYARRILDIMMLTNNISSEFISKEIAYYNETQKNSKR
jgi:hypothetical protein